MGRATRDNPPYQDDPDAVSLHTTPDDYNYDDAPELSGLLPPSYADSENVSTPTTAAPAIRHITPVTTRKDHNRWYELSGGVPKVCDTVVRMDASCDTDPVALESNILSLAHNPPIPLLYIMGTHKETVKKGDKKETQTIVDFRIVINMRKYLSTPQAGEGDSSMMTLHTVENGEKTYRGSFMNKRAPGFKQDIEIGSTKPTLKEWCHRYCASPSMLRIFRMSHTISGFDETFLKNRIDGMLRSTNYRGHISVTFPIEDANLDFYTSNWINQWRMKTWVCWIFYLTFLWIFTWPYLYFATKRWYVVKADWAFSTLTPNGKIYTHISESDWFEKWSVGIRRLALDRYQGEATEPQLEGVMARPEDPPIPVQIQPINLGSVRSNPLGALSQGLQIAGALSRGTVPGTTNPGWGYDS